MNVARTACIALLLLPASITGQDRGDSADGWRFLTRVTLSGDSHESTPVGYKIYSGLGLEAALARRLGEIFSLELSVRTESREVEGPSSLTEPRLGSLELIPVSLTLKWEPRGGTDAVFQPYAGAGLILNAAWEKSGQLDSTDPPISLGPVGHFGSNLVLRPGVALTLDVKWHPFDVDLEGFANPAPNIAIDPLVLGAGLAFVF